MSVRNIVAKLKTTSTNSLARTAALIGAALIGIVAAVAGPFLMLTIGGRDANNLTWFIWAIIPALLLAVIAAGFLMFKRESHDSEDISISPKHR